MRPSVLLLIPMLACLGGCQVAKGQSSGAATDPDVKSAAAVSGLIATIIQAAANNVAQRGTNNNVVVFAASSRDATTGTVTVDLDNDGTGIDRFPNATGRFQLTTSAEAFVTSWPSATTGQGETDCTISFTTGQAVTYLDPVSNAQATLATPGLVFHLSLTWTKASGPTPATHTMNLTATVDPSAAGAANSRMAAAGSVAGGPAGAVTWGISGTRTQATLTERTASQGTSDNTTTVTNASADILVSIAGRPTIRMQRTGSTTITITAQGADGSTTQLANGALSSLPATLGIHGEPLAW
jgi:hypothetical protein